MCSRSETKAVGAERHGGGSEVGLGVVCAGMSSPVPQSPLMGGVGREKGSWEGLSLRIVVLVKYVLMRPTSSAFRPKIKALPAASPRILHHGMILSQNRHKGVLVSA